MKKIINLTILLCLLSFSACAPTPIPTLEIESQPTITDDNATITFYRNSLLRVLDSVALRQIDESNNVINLIDFMHYGRNIKHIIPAGKYTYIAVGRIFGFMDVGGNFYFMEANLEAGKNYYVRVNPHFSLFKTNFSFTPVTEEEFLEKKAKNTYIANPTATSKRGTKKIIKKYNKWLKLDESKKTYLTN